MWDIVCGVSTPQPPEGGVKFFEPHFVWLFCVIARNKATCALEIEIDRIYSEINLAFFQSSRKFNPQIASFIAMTLPLHMQTQCKNMNRAPIFVVTGICYELIIGAEKELFVNVE